MSTATAAPGDELVKTVNELIALMNRPQPKPEPGPGVEEFILLFVTDLRAERDSLQKRLADTTLTVVEMYRIMGKVEGIKGMLRRLEMYAEMYGVEV